MQQHGLVAAVPSGSDLSDRSQAEISSELQGLHASSARALEDLRGHQREAQQEAQQRLSTVEAKLASFQTDVSTKSSSQAAIQRKPPSCQHMHDTLVYGVIRSTAHYHAHASAAAFVSACVAGARRSECLPD